MPLNSAAIICAHRAYPIHLQDDLDTRHNNARPNEPGVMSTSQSAVTLRVLLGDGSPVGALCVMEKRGVGNCGFYANIGN